MTAHLRSIFQEPVSKQNAKTVAIKMTKKKYAWDYFSPCTVNLGSSETPFVVVGWFY